MCAECPTGRTAVNHSNEPVVFIIDHRGGSKGGHRGHVPPRQSAQTRDRASGGLLVNVRHGMAVDGRELKEGYHAWLA